MWTYKFYLTRTHTEKQARFEEKKKKMQGDIIYIYSVMINNKKHEDTKMIKRTETCIKKILLIITITLMSDIAAHLNV
jgi:hypothetical protein